MLECVGMFVCCVCVSMHVNVALAQPVCVVMIDDILVMKLIKSSLILTHKPRIVHPSNLLKLEH